MKMNLGCMFGRQAFCAMSFAAAWAAVSSAGAALTAASYAQDGLVGQWDGIENAGAGLPHVTTNYWVDLTGQTGDFAVYTSCAAFTENGLKKNTAGIMATNVTATARTDVRPIEVVVSGAPSSGWVNAFFITRNQTVTFNNTSTKPGKSQYRDFFFDADKFGWLTLQKPPQLTIAATYGSDTTADNFCQNGAKPAGEKSTNNWGAPNGSSAMHIGGRTGLGGSGDAKTIGYTIHAVRLYDRALTQEEIRRHAMIDQIRFFGAPADLMPSDGKCALTATAGTGGMVAVDDVDAPPDATAKMELTFSQDVFPVALRAVPLPGWKFSGWTGDFSCVIEGSASTPVIVVSPGCGHAYQAAFARDPDNPEIPYVTDGLVGRWDGLENAGEGIHNTATNRWVDLSGQGGDFILRTQTASFTETGLKKKAVGVCATNLVKHTNVLTIESVLSGVPESGWVTAAFLGKNQTVTLRNEAENKKQFFFDWENLKWNMEWQPNELTVAVVYALDGTTPKGQTFYIDGAPPQNGSIYGSGMYWNGQVNEYTWIGGRMNNLDKNDATTYGYTLQAFRFYNRVLTAGEIAYNSAVDRLRFRGLRKEGFAYRLVNGNVQCQLRAWMDGLGGTVSVDGGAAATDRVETAWVAFGTAQTATFTATPEHGWTFLGWAGDTDAIVSGMASDLTVSVSATHGVALQAVFTRTAKYAQDGLIGFWDSLENAGFGHYDPNATAWKDLTGISGDFHLNAASGVFETNALYKVRRGRMAFNAKRRTDVRTVEAVVSSLPKNAWAVAAFVSHKQHITIRDQGEGNVRQFFFDRDTSSDAGHYGWQTAERPEQMTVTVLSESASSAVDCFVNGAKPEGSEYGNWWGDSPGGVMVIGARGSVSGGDTLAVGYRVHAVRFYDRQLTESEIRRNARQDAIRYFGQPEPGMTLIVR